MVAVRSQPVVNSGDIPVIAVVRGRGEAKAAVIADNVTVRVAEGVARSGVIGKREGIEVGHGNGARPHADWVHSLQITRSEHKETRRRGVGGTAGTSHGPPSRTFIKVGLIAVRVRARVKNRAIRSEEHTSELQSRQY